MWVQRIPDYAGKSVSPTQEHSINQPLLHSKQRAKARKVGKTKERAKDYSPAPIVNKPETAVTQVKGLLPEREIVIENLTKEIQLNDQ